jgi:hypothetical protein
MLEEKHNCIVVWNSDQDSRHIRQNRCLVIRHGQFDSLRRVETMVRVRSGARRFGNCPPTFGAANLAEWVPFCKNRRFLSRRSAKAFSVSKFANICLSGLLVAVLG